jgi:thiol-disulfide isomerase/thioredoxin
MVRRVPDRKVIRMMCVSSRRWLCPLLCALLLAAGLASPAAVFAQADVVFRDMAVDDAIRLAREQDRVLLLYFTTDWCVPCQAMKRTTWVDPDVIAWLGEHTVAILIDGDRRPADVRRYQVSAYPTLIAIRDGEEFDRVEAFVSAEGLLTWLRPIRDGVHPLDAMRQKAEQTGEMQDHFHLIGMLLGRNMIPEAAERTLGLWDELDDYRDVAVRQPHAQIFQLVAQFAAAHPPTRQALEERFEAHQRDVDADAAAPRQVQEWILLAAMLNRSGPPLAWHDRLASDEAGRERLANVGPLLEPLLVSRKRYAEIGRLYPQPIQRVQELARHAREIDADPAMADNEQGRQGARAFFVDVSSHIYVGLLAAGREQEAAEVAEDVVDTYGQDATLALVNGALSNGQPRQAHRQLLAAVTADNAQVSAQVSAQVRSLRDRLDAALGSSGSRDASGSNGAEAAP